MHHQHFSVAIVLYVAKVLLCDTVEIDDTNEREAPRFVGINLPSILITLNDTPVSLSKGTLYPSPTNYS